MAITAPRVGAVIVHYEHSLSKTQGQHEVGLTLEICQFTLPPNHFQHHYDDAAKYHNDANFYNPSRLQITA